MAYSYEMKTGDGTTTLFTFTFNYISKDHVKVAVDGVDTAFTWSNDNTVSLATAPADGATVKIYRDTPKTDRVVDFQNGGGVTEEDLDNSALQGFYLSQEAFDKSSDVLHQDDEGNYDAASKKLVNLADAENEDEAPNLAQVEMLIASNGTVLNSDNFRDYLEVKKYSEHFYIDASDATDHGNVTQAKSLAARVAAGQTQFFVTPGLYDIATASDTLKRGVPAGFTFTRASSATRIGPTGLVESLYNNNIRHNYNAETLGYQGVLVEGSRTNLVLQSNGIAVSGGVFELQEATVTLNAGVSPSGSADATRLIESATTATHRLRWWTVGSQVLGSTAYTFSCYAKAGERAELGLVFGGSGIFNLATGAVTFSGGATGGMQRMPNGWWRCWITWTTPVTPAAGSPYADIRITGVSYLGDGSSGLYVWGAQLEQGSSVSSYIPTTTAAVTRAADVLTGPGGQVAPGLHQYPVFEIPAGVTLEFMDGAKLRPATGISIDYNGCIVAGAHQIFDLSSSGYIVGRPQVDTVDPHWWGATGDGITDDTDALESTLGFAQQALNFNGNNDLTLTVSCAQDMAISSQIVVPAVNRLTLDLRGTVKVVGWDMAATDPAFIIRANQSVINITKLDCNRLCAGIQVAGSYNTVIRDTIIQHFQTYGFNYYSGSNCHFENINSTQWTQADPEYPVDSEWDAIGILVDSIDSRFFSCSAAWTKVPLKFSEKASGNFLHNCHIWHGRSPGFGEKPVDPVIVENWSDHPNFMSDCYFDNGHVKQYRTGLVIDGGWYLEYPDAVTLSEPYIRYYNLDGDLQPFAARVYNIKASVGFFAGDGGSYEGDYSAINAYNPLTISGSTVNVARQRVVITPTTQDTIPTERHMRPGGPFIFNYNTGGTVGEVHYKPDEMLVRWPQLRVKSIPGTLPHLLKFGGGNTGIGEETVAGQIDVWTGSTKSWMFGNATIGCPLFPATDNVHDIGRSSHRVKEIHAGIASINTASDEREKRDIANSDLGLAFVNSLRPVSYRPKDGDALHYGLIAQEVEAAMGNHERAIVTHDAESDRYGMRYQELLAPMIKAIQEQQAIIESLQAEIAAMKMQ